jgi:rhodanese-related sulfurtransferase
MNGSTGFFTLLVLGTFWTSLFGQADSTRVITPQAVLDKIKAEAPVVVVDVRTPEEFKGELGHVPGAILVPLQDIETKPGVLDKYRKMELITVCRSGRRSLSAATSLAAKGFNVKSMAGGMTEWNRLKYPIKK